MKKHDIHCGNLILVNSRYPVAHRMMNRLTEYTEVMLEKTASLLLGELISDIDGKGEIIATDGYRSYSNQQKIYNKSLYENGKTFTSKYVALPGHSEHQTGLAVDLAKRAEKIDAICPDFPSTGICGRFRKHAARYGFIERYGKGKESITGIAHEPWHFRYVGYPHSVIMAEKNFCLEEYIDYLENFPVDGKHLYIEEGNKKVEIYYQHASGDLAIPEGSCYQVSGNNRDGFIFTVWRSLL